MLAWESFLSNTIRSPSEVRQCDDRFVAGGVGTLALSAPLTVLSELSAFSESPIRREIAWRADGASLAARYGTRTITMPKPRPMTPRSKPRHGRRQAVP